MYESTTMQVPAPIPTLPVPVLIPAEPTWIPVLPSKGLMTGLDEALIQGLSYIPVQTSQSLVTGIWNWILESPSPAPGMSRLSNHLRQSTTESTIPHPCDRSVWLGPGPDPRLRLRTVWKLKGKRYSRRHRQY